MVGFGRQESLCGCQSKAFRNAGISFETKRQSSLAQTTRARRSRSGRRTANNRVTHAASFRKAQWRAPILEHSSTCFDEFLMLRLSISHAGLSHETLSIMIWNATSKSGFGGSYHLHGGRVSGHGLSRSEAKMRPKWSKNGGRSVKSPLPRPRKWPRRFSAIF